MKDSRQNFVRGGTEYPPVFEVVIRGETVGVHDNYRDALAAFKMSCRALGIRVPKVVLNP